MHHRKARDPKKWDGLVKFVGLPGMVEAGVLRYPHSSVQYHTPFW